MSPKTVFISTLKNYDVQKKLINLFKKEDIRLLITTTSFSSSLNSSNENIDSNLNIFNSLNLPILQYSLVINPERIGCTHQLE